ncbi:NAD(P)H-dependent glycerol-3-phosphate dehydrogenase [Streptomyces yaizuensis]|uniref:Glycerol-3-phosphate dehydrogenase [NAD(P)+] n=1 Tax=Streptomyces yaizuensis TaxID=2989713 RepID=A0ABQ5NQT2_9ACTN|nr:NAD(P)H-dependent glycerol-3-phosphate dehydrogenase [Streptomyces sp. YSPA8]GLF92717.1 NAD(P)-dependent glycerol-3-phosphate dehydrogenase [Streptomyces sp. YSPA8]
MARVAVYGAGSWGTATAVVLADAGCRVALWGRRPELVRAINTTRTNPDYLPGSVLPHAVTATADPAEAADGAEVAFLCVSAQQLRGALGTWAPAIRDDTVLVSLMKGVELGTGLLMSQVIAEVTGAGPERIGVVSGPNLAREIAARQPAASVVACRDLTVAARLQEILRTPCFRPYTNADVIGCELGGAVKNVIALAVGMADGMGLGDNTKATLMTRGLAETSRLGAAMGADPRTFAGLAGMGDLIATCASPLSRNHTFGANLGRGMSVAEAAAAMTQTAEGVTSCASVLDLAKRHGVEMPIAEAVVGVIRAGVRPRTAVKELMGRAAGSE